MIIIISVIAFILPLALRKYFVAVQAVMAVLWVITLYVALPNQFQNNILAECMIISLPTWIFSSLIALELRSKNFSLLEIMYHEKALHQEKK